MYYTEKEVKREKNEELALFIGTITAVVFDLVVGIINLVAGFGTPLVPLNIFLGVLLLVFVAFLISLLGLNWTRYQFWKGQLEKIRKSNK